MKYSEDQIKIIKDSNNIIDVIADKITMSKKGNDFICQCPFCKYKTSSFNVYNETQSFYCFSCKTGGDVITFVMKYYNLNYKDAIKWLCERGNINIEPIDYDNKLMSDVAKYYYKTLSSENGIIARQWLFKNNIKAEYITKFGLGYNLNSWHCVKEYMISLGYSVDKLVTAYIVGKSEKKANIYYDRMRNSIIFPIINNKGNVIAFDNVVIDKNYELYRFPNTNWFIRKENLFAINLAVKSDSKFWFVSNSYIDTIFLHQMGYDNVVSILGPKLTVEQLDLIYNYVKIIVLLYKDIDVTKIRAYCHGNNMFCDNISFEKSVSVREYLLENSDSFIKEKYNL